VPEKAAGTVEEFELIIRYQACNDNGCERPKTLKFAAKVPVAKLNEKVNPINTKVFNPAP
jgi:hypothetical protein